MRKKVETVALVLGCMTLLWLVGDSIIWGQQEPQISEKEAAQVIEAANKAEIDWYKNPLDQRTYLGTGEKPSYLRVEKTQKNMEGRTRSVPVYFTAFRHVRITYFFNLNHKKQLAPRAA